MVDTMYTKYIRRLHNTLFQLSDYQPRIFKIFCNIKSLNNKYYPSTHNASLLTPEKISVLIQKLFLWCSMYINLGCQCLYLLLYLYCFNKYPTLPTVIRCKQYIQAHSYTIHIRLAHKMEYLFIKQCKIHILHTYHRQFFAFKIL